MFLIVIATTFAANLLWSSHIEARRARSMLALDQGRQYALGGEAWAAEILTLDRQDSEIDSLEEVWAQALPPLPIDGGQIQGAVVDMQSRFNLNNLVDSNGQKDLVWFAVFQRLLISLDLQPEIADRVLDWLDPDVEVSFPGGAEDDTYTGNSPPYRTANGYITHVSELLAVAGIDAVAFAALEPHIAALPSGTLININTATGPVIAALDENLSIFDGEAIVQVRADQPFSEISELEGYVDPGAYGLVSFSSRYFQVTTVVSFAISRYTMFSLLERDPQSGATVPRLRNLING